MNCSLRGWLGLSIAVMAASDTHAAEKIVRPGVKEVQVSMAELNPTATFELGGDPDWMSVGDDAVWISVSRKKAVFRIDAAANKVAAKVEFPGKPGSGLALGFGSLWVPIDGEKETPATLARVDTATNRIITFLSAGPADSEGGITTSDDSVWIVTDTEGTLARIDPSTNKVRQKISVPAGSFNPLYADGVVWVTGNASNVLTAVDAKSGDVIGSVPVGPKPRFLTAGAGSVWTLNQGDGSVTRVDTKSRRVVATIAAGIPGHGGEICFGGGAVWATMMDIPLTRIDVASNTVTRQWTGIGGDSVRFGHGSLWLTDIKHGLLWREEVPAGKR
jgi:streptogramin lyase